MDADEKALLEAKKAHPLAPTNVKGELIRLETPPAVLDMDGKTARAYDADGDKLSPCQVNVLSWAVRPGRQDARNQPIVGNFSFPCTLIPRILCFDMGTSVVYVYLQCLYTNPYIRRARAFYTDQT
jgi:hypothetical protein